MILLGNRQKRLILTMLIAFFLYTQWSKWSKIDSSTKGY
ncbi:hypothetical protein VPHPS15B6_0063 [Vibrio phage PS15B-6]